MRISDWSSDVCSSDLLGRCGGDFEGQRVADLGILARLHLHLDLAAVDELAEEQFLGERLLDLFLDQPAHRARALELVIALRRQPLTRRIVELDMDVAVGELQFEVEDESVEDRKSTRQNYSPYSASRIPTSS